MPTDSSIMLALTQDSRFFGGGDIIKLGTWCCNDDGFDQCLEDSVDDYQNDKAQTDKDYDLIINVYEKYLDSLAVALADYHGIERSSRYWRIVLGGWLGDTIGILHDRYSIIKSAQNFGQNLDTNFKTLLLPQLRFDSPGICHQDIINAAASETFNHQLFSEIIRHLNLFTWSEVPARDDLYSIDKDIISGRYSRGRKSTHRFRDQAVQWLHSIEKRLQPKNREVLFFEGSIYSRLNLL